MAYYLTIVPSDERNQTFHERYSFYKACFTLREAYVLNREKYCYCDKFEGPALASGSTLNCLVCKATVAWDFFDLSSIKDSISALKKLYLESEEFNFEMVMDNIPPFWIKDSYKEARQIDKETREINEVLPNLLKYIFLMRSQLIWSFSLNHGLSHVFHESEATCTNNACMLSIPKDDFSLTSTHIKQPKKYRKVKKHTKNNFNVDLMGSQKFPAKPHIRTYNGGW